MSPGIGDGVLEGPRLCVRWLQSTVDGGLPGLYGCGGGCENGFEVSFDVGLDDVGGVDAGDVAFL